MAILSGIKKAASKSLEKPRHFVRNMLFGIKTIGDDVVLAYAGKTIKLRKGAVDCWEIFGQESYRELGVGGKNVVDVGTSIGDTPIYFSLRGALMVYGFECDSPTYQIAVQNLNDNGIDNVKMELRKVESAGQLTGIPAPKVMKMDIEGGEYGFFATASREEIRQYDEIIIEFHRGSAALAEKLRACGFETSEHRHPLSSLALSALRKDLGLLYAKRIGLADAPKTEGAVVRS
jgi:hypothetical protein